MSARVTEVVVESIVRGESGFGARITEVVVDAIVSGYASAPTVPTSGVSFTEVVVESLIRGESGFGVRFTESALDVIISGESFLPSNISGGYNNNPNLAPVWGSWNCANGVVNAAYQEQWDLRGCYSPTTYTLVSGSLPPGLSLASVSGNQGQITGTPSTAGAYSFTLRATNAYGTADKALTITISSSASGGSFVSIC